MKALALLSLVLLLATQGPREIQKLLDAAQKAHDGGEDEKSARILADACIRLEKVPAKRVRLELRKRARSMLRKVDKHHASAVNLRRSVAKSLLRIASSYHKLGWHRMATILAKQADQMDPGSAKQLLERLPKERSDRMSDAKALMQGAKALSPDHKWTLATKAIQSPGTQSRKHSRLLFESRPVSDWSLSTVVVIPRTEYRFGLLFAYQSEKEYFVLDFRRRDKRLLVRLDKVEADEDIEYYSMSCAIPASAYNKGLPIRLSLQGTNIRFQIGSLHERVIDVGLIGSMGQLGLSTGGSTNTPALTFRNIVLTEH